MSYRDLTVLVPSRQSSKKGLPTPVPPGALSRQSTKYNLTDADAEGGASLPYESIIHFTNSDAVVNLANPWKVNSPQTSTGTGFYIGDRKILTNCHVVRDNTSLRVFKHGVPGNYAATVLCQSAVCDLALVTVHDESFWTSLPAVKFQERVPSLDDEVCAVGYPLGAKSVTNTRGVVANVAISDLSLLFDLQEEQLCVQIDAAINPGNSGGPVFNKSTGEVVGVAFSGRNDAEGMGFIIPTPVVRNFLSVYQQTGDFGRLPDLGIQTQDLENSAMRSLLFSGGGAPPAHHEGVLVLRVHAHSCAAAAGVKPGDIVMAIDGHAVSEEGEVTFRDHERVDYKYLITKKKVGDEARLSVLRSKHAPADASAPFDLNKLAEEPATPEPLELSVTLSPTHELVPRELHKDYTAQFILIGGLVFVVAGLPLLQQAERQHNWVIFDAVRSLLSPQPAARDESKDAKSGLTHSKEVQALLCTNCLAHEVNEGYRCFVGDRLRRVNGVDVRNMAHAVALLAPLLDEATGPPPKSHLVLQFWTPRSSAVFDVKALRAATPTIMTQHMVPNWTNCEVPSASAAKPTDDTLQKGRVMKL